MKILVIGNGFDLANGLPTRYADFLRMCEISNSPYVYYTKTPNDYLSLSEEDNVRFAAFCSTIGKDYYNEFKGLSGNNLFINHFLDRRKVIGSNWLNFEEEIERLIKGIVDEMNRAPDERVQGSNNIYVTDFCKMNPKDTRVYKDLFKAIRIEHKKLIRLLEIYMGGYINKLQPQLLDCFKKGFYDHVISFNYTDTYSEKYEADHCDFCYIHGRARTDNASPCKMVLGFDDRHTTTQMSELEMLPYEKFFQRLELGTSNEYMTWLNNMDNEERNLIDIYGHSLAQADADVLSAFMLKPRTLTRVFYYDDIDRYDKMRNLTMILKSEKTIELVGGINPRIIFIPKDRYSTNVCYNF